MRDLNELNINDGEGDPVPLSPPSDTDIAEFEAMSGMPFPSELKSFLQFSNGGHPELDSVGGGEGGCAVNSFYHLTADDKGFDTFWRGIEVWRPILGKNVIPFAETGGGDPFLLDVSVIPHSVKICRHDEDMEIFDVSPTFEAFIDSLAINPDYL